MITALLVPLGFTPAASQSSAQRADRETLRTQKRAVKRLRRTEKKFVQGPEAEGKAALKKPERRASSDHSSVRRGVATITAQAGD
jgi:hypothetical protein